MNKVDVVVEEGADGTQRECSLPTRRMGVYDRGDRGKPVTGAQRKWRERGESR